MTREDFKKIIALRSIWTVGKGDYELPDGKFLHNYISELVRTQLAIDSLMVGNNGSLYKIIEDGKLLLYNGTYENCTPEQAYERKERLIFEILNESQPIHGKELDLI